MGEGLAGLQVVELGGGIAAATTTKLLADLGATVVKLEPPEGDPIRRRGPFRYGKAGPETGGTHLFLNSNKRSITCDLAGAAGRSKFVHLAERAHLIVHDLPPAAMTGAGLDFERLAAANPALVLLSITPFGLTGPFRDYAANDLTLIHAGGWGWIIPGKSTPLERPPLKPFGSHVLVQAGLHAAAAALAACHGAEATGVGEHVDISVQEVVIGMLGRHFAKYTFTGETDARTSPPVYEPMNFYRCRDGFIYLICPEHNQWERFVALMGSPEWASPEHIPDRVVRGERAVELHERISAWTAEWMVDDLFHACQQQRVGAAPVYTFDQLARQEHLLAREFFAAQEHPVAGTVRVPGAPYSMSRPWWRIVRPAPLLGEANGEADTLFDPPSRNGGANADRPPAATGANGVAPPLEGVRVLDLSWVWAGPHCTQMLGFLGAEVIRVESSGRADLPRRTNLPPKGQEQNLNNSAYFHQLNQNKKSVAVDLSNPEGIEVVKRLAAHCDVMVSNFGTGVLEKLGLGPDLMHGINPALTIAMISAFGQTGPYRQYMGYGPLISPLAGVSAQTGYDDGLPRDVAMAYGDPNGGVYCAVAITAALLARRRTGEGGQVIDLSMWEAMLCTAFEGWMNFEAGNAPYPPMGNRDPEVAPHNVYRCAGEDTWVAVAAADDAQWRGLCRALGDPALADDPRFADAAARKANENGLDEIVGAWCAARERWAAARALQAEGVAAFPVLDSKDLVEDAHLAARRAYTNWPHAVVGTRTLMGAPWHFTRRANGLGKAAPLLGEDTDEVLERLLGLDAAARAELREHKAIE